MTSETTLFRAVKRGDAARTRASLEAGALLEATDPNRMTPVMLAARAGHEEVFRLLVESGADLHALGLGQTDLLECAAGGGNVQIIRHLLEAGHPIEGHWKPRSRDEGRTGHITPLIMAAINGHADAVRMLLAAGASRDARFDGQTALQLVTETIEHPIGEDQARLEPSYREIATLLRATPDAREALTQAVEKELARFPEHANRPEYHQLSRELSASAGGERPGPPLPDRGTALAGVVAYRLARCGRQADLEALQEQARAAGCHLVLAEPWVQGEDAALVLFPTSNKLAVVAASGTEGPNHGVRNEDVLQWLDEVDSRTPFHLVFSGRDLVGGAFLGPVRDAGRLAATMAALCPSCLDEGPDSPRRLAAALRKRRSFLLRWD
jgi:hypothetical protein